MKPIRHVGCCIQGETCLCFSGLFLFSFGHPPGMAVRDEDLLHRLDDFHAARSDVLR